MSDVSSVYVRKAIEQANSGLEKAKLFQLAGLAPADAEDLTQMVSEEAYCELLETIATAEAGAIGFHVRLGAAMTCDEFGALGLAWKSSRTLADGFHRVARYVSLLARPRQMEIEPGEESSTVVFHRLTDSTSLGAQLSNEATFATITAICREASRRDFRPLRIHCAHEPIGDVALLETYLGCPAQFGAGVNAMVIANEDLHAANALGDAGVSKFFDDYLERQLSSSPPEMPLKGRVRHEIAKALSAGVPKLPDVAAELGMSARTLQRRLGEEGAVYQALVDETRAELAQRLLRTTDYPLVEVAFLTGFAEQSGFTRAFKRWAGQAPRSYRITAE